MYINLFFSSIATIILIKMICCIQENHSLNMHLFLLLCALGTLVRICAAAGCQSFITSTGCVDLWDPKVLRCAAGGHFYVPVHYNLEWEEIEALIKDKRIFLADSNIPGE